MPKLHTKTDGFTNLVNWEFVGVGASATGGRLRLNLNAGYDSDVYDDFAGTPPFWDLTDSYALVELVTVAPAGNGTRETWFMVQGIDGGGDMVPTQRVGFIVTGNPRVLRLLYFPDGAENSVDITFDATAHRWLKFGISGGTLYWQTSATGYDNDWVTRRVMPKPTTWGSAVAPFFKGGYWGTETADYSEFDNLNLAPTFTDTRVYPDAGHPIRSVERRLLLPSSAAPRQDNGDVAYDIFFGPSLTAPTVVAIGQVSETDTAQTFGRSKSKLIGQITETDAGQILRALKSKLIGQTLETDTTQALSAIKTKLLGQTAETDSAQALRSVKTKAIGQSVETDTPQALRAVRSRLLGQPSETDTPQTLARSKTKQLGQASETDTAQAIRRITYSSSYVSNFDTTLPTFFTSFGTTAVSGGKLRVRATPGYSGVYTQSVVSLDTVAITVETPGEYDSTIGLGSGDPNRMLLGVFDDGSGPTVYATEIVAGGYVGYVDTPVTLPCRLQMRRSGANIVFEYDTGSGMTTLLTRTAPSYLDGGSYLNIFAGGSTVGPYAVFDSLNVLPAATTLGITAPTETDTAQPLSRIKTKTIGQVVETDTAQAQRAIKSKAINQVGSSLWRDIVLSTSGLLSLHEFEAASGTSITDASGNGRTMTLSGAANFGYSNPSLVGNGIRLATTGIGNWNVANTAAYQVSEFSVEALVYLPPNKSALNMTLFSSASTLPGSFQGFSALIVRAAGDTNAGLQLTMYTNPSAGDQVTANIGYGWHHIVISRDGAGLCKLNIDNALSASKTMAFTPGTTPSNWNGLIAFQTDAMIDELAVYNRALSDVEVGERWQALPDLAVPFERRKTKAIGQQLETDTTQPLGRVKTKTIGQVSESDSTQPISFLTIRTLAIAAALETDTAQPLRRLKIKAIGQVVETDTAQALDEALDAGVGQVTETDTAQPLRRVKTKTIGQVVESVTPQPIGKSKTKTIGQTSETSSVSTLANFKIRTIGQVVQTDTAQHMVLPIRVVLGQVVETDSARSLTPVRVKSIGQVSEVSTAQPFTVITTPVVKIVEGPDVRRISTTSGQVFTTFRWEPSQPIQAYKIKIVDSPSSIHTEGIQIPTTGGSINTSGGAVGAHESMVSKIHGLDSIAADGLGVHVVKIFVQDLDGDWSVL